LSGFGFRKWHLKPGREARHDDDHGNLHRTLATTRNKRLITVSTATMARAGAAANSQAKPGLRGRSMKFF
jgi:hypothetical protein